jgi:hypothetical protein
MVEATTRPPARFAAIPILVVALILVLPVISSAQTAQGSFERTLTVSGPVDLDITTGSGHVIIRTGPAGSVKVVGRIHAGNSWFSSDRAAADKIKAIEAKPPIEQTGNAIRIGRFEDHDLQQNVSISYDIIAPVQSTLRSRTGSGDQTVDDISGPVDVSSGSGRITLGSTSPRARLGGRSRLGPAAGACTRVGWLASWSSQPPAATLTRRRRPPAASGSAPRPARSGSPAFRVPCERTARAATSPCRARHPASGSFPPPPETSRSCCRRPRASSSMPAPARAPSSRSTR